MFGLSWWKELKGRYCIVNVSGKNILNCILRKFSVRLYTTQADYCCEHRSEPTVSLNDSKNL
jgi:hypothetical protein